MALMDMKKLEWILIQDRQSSYLNQHPLQVGSISVLQKDYVKGI